MSRRHRTVRLVLLAVTLLVIVLVLIAWLWPREAGDPDDIGGATGSSDVGGYIVDPAPEGFQVAAVDGIEPFDEEDAPTATSGGSPWLLYGPADGRAQVLIAVDPDGGGGLASGGGGWDGDDAFDLDGRRAYRDDPDLASFGAESLIVDMDGAHVAVAGDVEPDVLDDIARATTVDGDEPIVDPSGLPAGWEMLGTAGPADLTIGSPDPSDARIVFYVTDEFDPDRPGPTMIQVIATPSGVGDIADLGGVFPILGASLSDIEVDGAPAVLMAMPGDDGDVGAHVVAWEPEPGVSVRLNVYGIDMDVDSVVELAERVRPATDEEWRTILDESEDLSGAMSTAEVESSGGGEIEGVPDDDEASDPDDEESSDPDETGSRPGLTWEAYIDDGELELVIAEVDDGTSTATPLDGDLPIAVATSDEDVVIGGIIEQGRKVEVEPAENRWDIELDDGRTLWVADIGDEDVIVTLFDSDGEEITSRPFPAR